LHASTRLHARDRLGDIVTTTVVPERRSPQEPGGLLDRLPETLRKGLSSIGWMGLGQFTCLLIRLASNIILARLLAPQIYGVFGTALAVITTLTLFSDIGVQPALIRHPNGMRPEFLSTGWWMNLGRGAGLMIITLALAYPLARVYGEPILFPVLLVLALQPLAQALRSPGMPLLRRTLNYRAVFLNEVSLVLVGAIASVALAVAFRSVWAIVFGSLIGLVASVAFSYVLSPIAPRLTWASTAFQEIAQLSRQIFVNTLVMALWVNLDRLLGLWFVDETAMGCYFVAMNLAVVGETLVMRACDVYFSMLSRCADLAQRAAWHRRVNQSLAAWGMPVLALGIVAAPAFIDLIYDPRYAPGRLVFAVMAARFMFRALSIVQFQYLLSLAEVRLNTRAYVLAVAVQAACFWPLPLVRSWGIMGIALAGLISAVVMTATQSVILRLRHASPLTPFLATLAWASLGLAAMAWTQGLIPIGR
jgi:O-antigen/teichoic acid export membrane protein